MSSNPDAVADPEPSKDVSRDPDTVEKVKRWQRAVDGEVYFESLPPEDRVMLAGWLWRMKKGLDFHDELYSALAARRTVAIHERLIKSFTPEEADEYFLSTDSDARNLAIGVMKRILKSPDYREEVEAARELRRRKMLREDN